MPAACGSGYDPLLNPAWARYRDSLHLLLALEGSRGCAAWEKPDRRTAPDVTELRPGRIAIDADSSLGGAADPDGVDVPG